jgi:hypothetical protein
MIADCKFARRDQSVGAFPLSPFSLSHSKNNDEALFVRSLAGKLYPKEDTMKSFYRYNEDTMKSLNRHAAFSLRAVLAALSFD